MISKVFASLFRGLKEKMTHREPPRQSPAVQSAIDKKLTKGQQASQGEYNRERRRFTNRSSLKRNGDLNRKSTQKMRTHDGMVASKKFARTAQGMKPI